MRLWLSALKEYITKQLLDSFFVISGIIIKITVSSFVIGLKKLPSCYRMVFYWTVCYWTVCYWTVVIGQFNKPITFKVVV